MTNTDDLRAAWAAGATIIVRPLPDTEVVVRAARFEDLLEIVRGLQPMPDTYTNFEAERALDTAWAILTVLEDVYPDVVQQFVRRINKVYVDGDYANGRYAE